MLAGDFDLQDIVALSLTRAIQLCVDIGAYLIAGTDALPPVTMEQTFDVLAELGYFHPELVLHMKNAVGFRNVSVHNYEAINWQIVYAIATRHLSDFRDFAQEVVHNRILNIEPMRWPAAGILVSSAMLHRRVWPARSHAPCLCYPPAQPRS